MTAIHPHPPLFHSFLHRFVQQIDQRVDLPVSSLDLPLPSRLLLRRVGPGRSCFNSISHTCAGIGSQHNRRACTHCAYHINDNRIAGLVTHAEQQIMFSRNVGAIWNSIVARIEVEICLLVDPLVGGTGIYFQELSRAAG